MKTLILFLSFFTLISFSQEKQVKLDADTFIGVDNLENIYYIKNNVFYKKSNTKTISYTNLHLGKIELADITNPLKIVVFYKDFNSVIILDDELNELSNALNFNTLLFKNIHFVGTSTNANLWLFSLDDNHLMLFNYLTKKVVQTKQIDTDFSFNTAIGSYHNIWLISTLGILKYNNYLSYLTQTNVKNIVKTVVTKNGIIYQIDNKLYYLSITNKPILIAVNKDINIKDFYYNNNLLYFFDGNTIYIQEFLKK